MGLWNNDDIDRPLDNDELFEKENRQGYREAWERKNDIFKDQFTRYENEEYLYGDD